jgi:pimeloyl-ACP methyl ester carboxylesterase
VELYVHERGEGRPLVALHGGPGLDGSVWFPGLDRVAEAGYRVLAPDHRANGRSDAGEPARWTVPQMADDVEALIRALALDSPVVIGWSFGSFVAQSHMVRHGSASGYVLIGTVAEPGALANVEHELATFEPEALRRQVAASWELEATVETPEQAKQLLSDQMPFHVADPTGPLVAELVAADCVVYRPEVLRHFAAGGEYGMLDLREELRMVTTPTLILSGAHDRTTPAASAHELAAIMPRCEEIVLSESAHMLPYEQPEEFTAALIGFLERT